MKALFDIWQQTWDTFYSLLRILLISSAPNKKQILDTTSSSCILLGNGPDLNIFLQNNLNFTKDKDLFCVNHFGETEAFTQLQPRYYVLNAPEMWRTDVEDFHREKGKKMFEAIAQKTTWPMTLFIQKEAKGFSEWKRIIEKNEHIQIAYFSPTPIEGFRSFRFWAFRKWLGMPRPHNVLVPSLMFAINMNYSEVFITGADHSWMKDLFVADDNQVYLTQKHFYDQDTAKARGMDKAGKGSRKLHEVLIKFYHSFAAYFVIKDYAATRNCRIFNTTRGSFIDAFERKFLTHD